MGYKVNLTNLQNALNALGSIGGVGGTATVTGNLAAPASPSFTITLSGGHSGGAINGTGSGKLSANKNVLDDNKSSKQRSRQWRSRLRRARTS